MKKLFIIATLFTALLAPLVPVIVIAQEPMQIVCEDSTATATYSSLFQGSAFLNAWNDANNKCAQQGKVGVDPQHTMDCGWVWCTATTTVRCHCLGQ